jgi:hypothetical protein
MDTNTNALYDISNNVLHIEVLPFKIQDCYDMNSLIESGKDKYYFKDIGMNQIKLPRQLNKFNGLRQEQPGWVVSAAQSLLVDLRPSTGLSILGAYL